MSVKDLIRTIKYNFYDFIYPNALLVQWDQGDNFGDALNPFLISSLSGKNVVYVRSRYYKKPHILAIGSILHKSTSQSIIWGSGYMSNDIKCENPPLKICAVRGPKTREKLLEQRIDCPEVYGDPALLLPYVYNPNISKKYKLGIIPHYVDKENPVLEKFRDLPDVCIIDVRTKHSTEFIDNLLSCEKIASSSLHGIITADAYGIPSIWLEFSKNVKGNGFKFLDYFLSVNRIDSLPLRVEEKTNIEDIYSHFTPYKINIDIKKLLDAAPFDIKDSILQKVSQ